MSHRATRALVLPFLILSLGALGTGPVVGSDILAEADFEGDEPGDLARPGVPGVEEEVYEDSDTTGGTSAVESAGGGLRYRISDLGTQGAVRGIRMPFSETATSGTVAFSADISAASAATGGVLTVSDPNEDRWVSMVAFGSDGKFRVHGQNTAFDYDAGTTYRVTATLTLEEDRAVVDYRIENLSDSEDFLALDDQVVPGAPCAGALRYRTASSADGSFAIDNVLVTRP